MIAGKMRKTSGKRSLIGIFCAFSSATAFRRLRISVARFRMVCRDRDAELLALGERADEHAHVRRVGPLTEAGDRLEDGEAHALLLKRQPDLLPERVLEPLGGDAHRGEDAETRFDRDDQQVDHVRHLAVDLLEALTHRAVDVHHREGHLEGPVLAMVTDALRSSDRGLFRRDAVDAMLADPTRTARTSTARRCGNSACWSCGSSATSTYEGRSEATTTWSRKNDAGDDRRCRPSRGPDRPAHSRTADPAPRLANLGAYA